MLEQLISRDKECVNASRDKMIFVYQISKVDAILLLFSAESASDTKCTIRKNHGDF